MVSDFLFSLLSDLNWRSRFKSGERGDRRRGRMQEAEQVAAVGKKRVSFVMRSFCRVPQQDSSSEHFKIFYTKNQTAPLSPFS